MGAPPTLPPDHPAMVRFRDVTARHRAGDVPGALAAYDTLVAELGDHPDLWNNRGIALTQLGRLDEAEASYARAVALNPRHADTHVNLGIVRGQQGDMDAAIAAFDQALALDPQHRAARGNRAAAVAARQGMALPAPPRPSPADALVAAGIARAEAGDWSGALTLFERGIDRDRHAAAAHANRGLMLRALGRPEEAVAALEQALALGLDDLATRHGLAEALAEIGRVDDALVALTIAIRRGGHTAALHARMGGLLAGIHQYQAALASYEAALALAPDDRYLASERGMLLTVLGRHDESLAAYDALLAAEPERPLLRGERLHMAMKLADWRDFDAQVTAIEAAGGGAATPFVLQTVIDDPVLQRDAAAAQLAGTHVPALPPPVFAAPATERRLRIGYVSADFHDHATMFLFADALAAHDRSRFEIVLASIGKASSDAMRARAVAAADRFLDLRDRPDATAAALLRQEQFDIAVDLKGLTGGSRPALLAPRVAPVQVNYLAFAGSMPAPWIDYMIVDPVVAPAASRAGYAEALAVLPHCYQPNCRDEAITPTTRAAIGLAEQGPVFVCFNQIHKITPPVFALWMRIMAAVPGSQLWLWSETAVTRTNLRRHAEAAGIAAERLVFGATAPRAQHLGRLALADLMLDTFPCGGHTTASDALKAGVPVLTRPGRSFASRVAASLLTTVGLSDLIAPDAEAYVDRAIALATDGARLADVRARLAAGLATSPLLDGAAYIRHLEWAYAAMHDRWRQGLAPADIVVPA